MKFRCDCKGHILEINYVTLAGDKPMIEVLIYDVYSPKTGRKYKKPKLLEDVILMNNAYPEEMNNFIYFIKRLNLEILDKRYVRCKYCELVKTPDEITKNGCKSCDIDYQRSLCEVKK